MSIGGGDEYDEHGRMDGSDPSMGRGGSTRHATRTRLPGEDGDVYGVGRRPPVRTGRSLITVVGVIVLLIAAIAFANRGGGEGDGGDSPSEEGKGGGAQPTAPTGEKPVDGADPATGIASGFPRTEQGAQSAAANYAVALGSAKMLDQEQRNEILNAVIAPSEVNKFRSTLDKAYSPAFFENAGLNADGSTPDGYTFVSRTSPIGTKVTAYNDTSATVEVWCSGLVGLAGEGSTNPVTDDWFTITFKLTWVDGDWKTLSHSQKDGPAPVSGDNRASGADELADAVEGYGGFTYAR